MPVYRLKIECAETLWITAHDEQGAIELASAHIVEGTLDDGALVQLKRDADEALILHAAVARWASLAKRGSVGFKAERCERCDDSGWACEAHDNRPWGDRESCCGAAGVPCPDCNPSNGRDDPPDDSRIMKRLTPPTP